MSQVPSKRTEYALIWLAVATAIGVSGYRLAVPFGELSVPQGAVSGGLSAEDWVTNALMLWSLAFLVTACLLWRTARTRQRELERIISSVSPDVLLAVTPGRVVTLCNPTVRDMFGHEPEAVRGHTTDMLYEDRRVTTGSREIYQYLEHHKYHIGPATGIRRDGSRFPIEVITVRLEGCPGAVVLIRDTSERKRVEAAVEAAKQELEESYRRLKNLESLRDNLTHMVVHDIKHAASGVGTSLDLLRRELGPAPSAAAQNFLATAEGFAADVLGMARSLLDISRLEAGQMPLNPTACDVLALAAKAQVTVRNVADAKRLRIVCEGEVPAVTADPDVLGRVMENLLANAVHFAPEGSTVTLRLGREDGGFRLEVRDEGPGVPAGFHARIFEKFGRVEMRRDGSDHSTGLGLTFCRMAIEAHGGRIGVISPSPHAAGGKGSVFWVTLPA